MGDKCLKHNTLTGLNFYKNAAHNLSEPEQNLPSVISRHMSALWMDAVILKLVPDNTSRPPFAYLPWPLCADAQMAAASSSLCSQMTLTQELNWPLFLRGCSLDTTCVCRRDNGGTLSPTKSSSPDYLCLVRACVRA